LVISLIKISDGKGTANLRNRLKPLYIELAELYSSVNISEKSQERIDSLESAIRDFAKASTEADTKTAITKYADSAAFQKSAINDAYNKYAKPAKK
jgi:hypothetical protein